MSDTDFGVDFDNDFDAVVRGDAEAFGVSLDEAQRERLLTFTRLLEKWNRSIRLTGPTDFLTLLREQVLEALAFLPFVRRAEAWWDVGSGGGLPALVLALIEPERRFWLIEPIAKKVAFLKHAVQQFGLTNVTVFHGRLEDDAEPPAAPRNAAGQEPPRAAMSRATFPPEIWYPLASRLVGEGGLVLIASVDRPMDLRPGETLSQATVIAEEAYDLPATGAQRHLLLLKSNA